jgi:nuclear transcription Y subunit beta
VHADDETLRVQEKNLKFVSAHNTIRCVQFLLGVETPNGNFFDVWFWVFVYLLAFSPPLLMSDDHIGMDSPGSPGEGPNLLREQDRYLPIANISRIMKKALPANAKIAKDAKETVQECVSEFISFITSEYAPNLEPPPKSSFLSWRQRAQINPLIALLTTWCCSPRASDKCQSEKRKTINGDDILSAMVTLGFDSYVEPLKLYLHKYREVRSQPTPQEHPFALRLNAIGPTYSASPLAAFSTSLPTGGIIAEHAHQEAAQEGGRVTRFACPAHPVPACDVHEPGSSIAQSRTVPRVRWWWLQSLAHCFTLSSNSTP